MVTHAKKMEILRDMEDAAGRLLPDDVVAAARDPTHPLHGHFEWDDSAAAEKFRRGQAQSLIRALHLTVFVAEMPLSVPAYVREAKTESVAGYRATLNVRDNDAELARSTVLDAMSRVAAAVKRAKSLAVLFGVDGYLAQIDELAAVVTGLTQPNIDDQPGGEA
jgi:hypothetical protein